MSSSVERYWLKISLSADSTLSSKKPRLLIHEETIVNENGTVKASIPVDKGKMISVLSQDKVHADEEIDASGLYVLLGLIDTHVHFRDPGMIQKEGRDSGGLRC
jgi:dihydroorotase